MKKFAVLFVLMLSVLLAACGGAPAEQWKTQEDVTIGVKYQIPTSWVAKSEDGSISIADSQETMDAEVLEKGAGVNLTTVSLAEFGGIESPLELLQFFTGFFTQNDAMTEVLLPSETTIQGQTAAKAVYKGNIEGQEGVFTVIVIVHEGRMAMVLGIEAGTDNALTAALDRVLNSIVILPAASN